MKMITSSSGHILWEVSRDGREWIFKPADARHAFLAVQEHAAATLARMFCFRTPESVLTEIDGQYGQLQARLDNVGDLEYGHRLGFYGSPPIPWESLTLGQLSDLGREHLLDWTLANDDSRASNYLRTPSGRIVGIDKGRMLAPGWERWQGLSGDSRADSRSAQVSTALYDAIRSHKITKERADRIRRAVMLRAASMAEISDAAIRAILVPALTVKHGADAANVMASAVAARKRSLVHDFADLWARIYADAGYGPAVSHDHNEAATKPA